MVSITCICETAACVLFKNGRETVKFAWFISIVKNNPDNYKS